MADDNTEFNSAMAATLAGKVTSGQAGAGSFTIVPGGWDVHNLEHLQAHPNRIREAPKFRDVRSLASYLERFERPESVAFSNPALRVIRVVVDYHEGGDGLPNHADHMPMLHAQFTAQYDLWRDFCGGWVSQKDAGEFLEERAVDVIQPDAAAIMDMVMQFDALKRVEFKQSTRLHDSTRQFHYVEENEARGAVTLPERMTLLLPVFDGQEPERILVRLRYDISDGKLRFRFIIHDQKQVEDTAFYRCEDALAAARPSLLMLRSL